MDERLPQGTKICKYCNQERSIDDYHSHSPNKCKNCCKEYARNQWRKKHGKPLDDPIQQGRTKRPDFDNPIERKCCSCKEIKSLELFKKDPNIHGGYGYICKKCHNLKERSEKAIIRRRESHLRNALKENSRRRASRYKTQLALIEYNEMLKRQDGKCAVCKQAQTTKNLAVDHDHATGKIRGLLCSPCNLALGLLKDDPVRISELLKYIQHHAIVL